MAQTYFVRRDPILCNFAIVDKFFSAQEKFRSLDSLRRPQNFAKSPPIISSIYCQSNNWWLFLKILWPSQNIWTSLKIKYSRLSRSDDPPELMFDNRTEDTCDLGGWCWWYEDLRWDWLEGVEAVVPPGVCKPEVAEVACIRCEIIWLCRATSGVLVWDCLCCCVCVWLGLFRNRTSSEILWIVILLIAKGQIKSEWIYEIIN